MDQKERRTKAQETARKVFGTYNWQGMKDVYAPSGLTRLANAYLRKTRPNGTNWKVTEKKLSDGESVYYVGSF